MQNNPTSYSKLCKFRLHGPIWTISVHPEAHVSPLFRLITMNIRLETRLRNARRELDKVRKLLDEANAALAFAGVPYQQGNIRERISAYQVNNHAMIAPI